MSAEHPIFNGAAFKSLLKEAVQELVEEGQLRLQTDEMTRQLAEIELKPRLTIAETVMLYRCSNDYLYDRIHEAEKKKTLDPIPFQWCGVYTFPHAELKEWLSRQSKPETKRRRKAA